MYQEPEFLHFSCALVESSDNPFQRVVVLEFFVYTEHMAALVFQSLIVGQVECQNLHAVCLGSSGETSCKQSADVRR